MFVPPTNIEEVNKKRKWEGEEATGRFKRLRSVEPEMLKPEVRKPEGEEKEKEKEEREGECGIWSNFGRRLLSFCQWPKWLWDIQIRGEGSMLMS